MQTGCSNKRESAENKNPVLIYLLSAASGEEWLKNVKDFSAIIAQERAAVPWPQAVRITDIAETENGKIAVLINKKGVITANPADSSINFADNAENIDAGLFFSSKITHEGLNNFTSNEIIKDSDTLLCHVYIDTFFDNSFSSPPSPFIQIDIDNKKSAYSQHNFPAVTDKFSLINLKKIDEKWFSAWKKSNSKETVFKYFIHTSPTGENCVEITESMFMIPNQFVNKSNLPDTVKQTILNIAKSEIKNNTVIEFEIRSKDNPVVMKYLLGASGKNYEKICISLAKEKYFISYKGEIYIIENDKLYLFPGAAKLPRNYNYTVLYAFEDMLYAAWEEQNFFLTGAAGLTMIDEKRVDKIPQ